LHVKMQRDQLAAWDKMRDTWRQEVVSDPKLGGQNLEATQKAANQVIRQFAGDPKFGGSPELMQQVADDLTLLGLGNKKSIIQLLMNISEVTKSGSISGTGGVGGGEKPHTSKILWPDMQ